MRESGNCILIDLSCACWNKCVYSPWGHMPNTSGIILKASSQSFALRDTLAVATDPFSVTFVVVGTCI